MAQTSKVRYVHSRGRFRKQSSRKLKEYTLIRSHTVGIRKIIIWYVWAAKEAVVVDVLHPDK